MIARTLGMISTMVVCLAAAEASTSGALAGHRHAAQGGVIRVEGNTFLKSSTTFGSSVKPPEGLAKYLHLGGTLNQTPDQIIAVLNAAIDIPLNASSKAILSSYLYQADGTGTFFMNLVIEPVNENNLAAFNNYVRRLESSGLLGMPVKFQAVDKFFLNIHLEAGTRGSDPENSFQQSYETTKPIALSSIHDWIDYTNKYGGAMLSKNSADFLGYLQNLIGDADTFQQLETDVLSKSNMFVIEADNYLILRDSTVVGPDMEMVPFMPFPFARNCWDKSFENGMCFTPAK